MGRHRLPIVTGLAYGLPASLALWAFLLAALLALVKLADL